MVNTEKKPTVSPRETAVRSSNVISEDQKMFEANCDTCGVEIKVPFRPDGKRPTFCKDCLRDYQRYIAKAKLKDERETKRQDPELDQQKEKQSPINTDDEKRIEPKFFESRDNPIVLSQIQHMEPKKFVPKRSKPEINLSELRNLINQSKNKNV